MSVPPCQIEPSEFKHSETGASTLSESHGLGAEVRPVVLVGERLLAAQAMRLLMRLDRELIEARAEFNLDRSRRTMRVRPQRPRRAFGDAGGKLIHVPQFH